MHKESYDIMERFVDKYLDKNECLEILDVGSYDVNGTYKPLFQCPKWNYYGLDMVNGPNVDYVSKSDYDFGVDKQFDVIVSGNCLEHVEAPWKWTKEVEKVTKKGGIICIITPFSIGEHRHPVDCWRILPDAYRYLLEQESNFKIIETKFNFPPSTYRFFKTRPKMNWLFKLLPNIIKKSIEIKPTIDTFAIAIKQ